eukprot:SAG31_NODE_10780_length_1099_cov_1.004000_1_plen_279_part_00
MAQLLLGAVTLQLSGCALSAPSAPLPKQVRWYVGDPNRPLDFLLGDNGAGVWANSTLNASDISGGVVNCCQSFKVLPNGSIPIPAGGYKKDATFQLYRTAGQQALVSVASPAVGAEFCWAALARLPDFTSEVMALIDGVGVDGINLVRLEPPAPTRTLCPSHCCTPVCLVLQWLCPIVSFVRRVSASQPSWCTGTQDWERGANNTIPCFLQLWGNVTKTMHAHGKRFAVSIDDSKGTPFNDSATAWSYEWDWLHFLPFTDELIDMGTCEWSAASPSLN